MLRTFLLSTLIACIVSLAVSAAAQSGTGEVLPAGTLFQCTLDEPNFSSHTAEIGDPILCHVAPLAVFKRSVFPRGADLAGHFQQYRDPGRLFGKGWIALAFDRLVLPGAVTLPLSVKVISVPRLRVDREGKIHGLGHPRRDAVGWAIPLLWPVKVLALPARGPRPAFKGEVRIVLRLLEDVEVPATVIAPRTISSTSPAPRLGPSSLDASSSRLWPGSSQTASAANALSRATPVQEQAKLVSVDLADHPPALTLLILKGGSGYLARDYWLEAGQLQFLTPDGEHKLLPLARLDLEETVRVNRERNVEFVLRTPDTSQP